MAIRLSRRHLLRTTGAAVVGASLASAAACASEEGGAPGGTDATDGAPEETFTEPTTQISGDLTILMWSHFVPAHDDWFAGFVDRWAERTGVNVRVDHIDVADIPARIAAEIQAGQGHDLLQYIAPCRSSSPACWT